MRVALIGWGAIGQEVGRLLATADVELVAVGVSNTTVTRTGLAGAVSVIDDPRQLADFAPDVVAEAAGRESVAPWGRAALACGADFVVSSVSAFADQQLLEELATIARGSGGRVQIQPGALAGVDALAAARSMGLDAVDHKMVKPPHAWVGTPAEDLLDLGSLTEATTFFSASAAETATAFPKNANVAMTTALAGVGPDKTRISLVADPGATTNRHEIKAAGAFGELDVRISNKALADNPKSSAMAALSLARAISNRVEAIVI